MKLKEYNRKRNFSQTSEPEGKEKKKAKGALRFVVQKHDATRLHYDFRLEVDGVLVSWAVPKGPSLDPSDKRLAMKVEDHPMDYFDFEGTIPEGNYGAGTVMVWDEGTYHIPESEEREASEKALKKDLHKGSLKIVLHGKKLKGEWALVNMNKSDNAWLLIKHDDDYASGENDFDQRSVKTSRTLEQIAEDKDRQWKSNRSEKKKNPFGDLVGAKKATMPKGLRPQFAKLTDAPFDSEDWIFEKKFDGYRALAYVKAGKVDLVSRNGNSFNKDYPDVVEHLEKIKADVIIDGEVVAEDENGEHKFQWLQNYKDGGHKGKLRFYVFDILYFQGFDLRKMPLLQRKAALRAVVPKDSIILYTEHRETKGKDFFKKAEEENWEGIIAKKKTARYADGKRTSDWLKIKVSQQQEMVIGGFTEPSGSRQGFGALLCGYYENGKLVYTGKVGTGYNDALLRELRAKLDKITRKTSPFGSPVKERGPHWVEPKLVAQVKFSEWTADGHMRHPVFMGLRNDKKAAEVGPEKEQPAIPIAEDKKTKADFTNLDKPFWPEQGWTKGHVIAYYNEMAGYVLPYLKDRAQSLRRTPNGMKDNGFFQKDVEGQVPEWIKTEKIFSESNEEYITYMLCQDKDTLLFMANWGCVELNPWSSRVGHLDHPDYVIIDLDPLEITYTAVVETALVFKEKLDELNIPGYVKTSGGKGMHIFIPVAARYTYEQTRTFSQYLSFLVNDALPKTTSLERMPARRKGKVYLDFLQNGKGKTMACAYSLRPRAGATVSTPLDWDEVNEKLDPKAFNIETVPARVKEKGDLWQNFFKDKISLKSVLERMAGMAG